MTLQTIKDLLHGSSPFSIRMASGRKISIPHPDFVALSQSETSLVFTTEGDRIEVVRISQIESIDTPNLPQTT
jgi:hypothetical protein